MASVCTLKSIREYLVKGNLPPNGIKCSVDEKFFPIPEEKSNGSHTSGRLGWLKEESLAGLSEEYLRLLDAGRALGTELHSFSLNF